MPSHASTSVPFMDLARHHAPIRGELQAEFERLLGSSAFILGAEVARFEDDFADYCGVGHCVGVGSGTAALSIMLQAAGVGPGDEVIVPAHTFIASALAVLHVGAVPMCCDVEPDTGLIDAEAARAAVTPRTTAVLAVHLYGQACDMDALRELCRTKGLRLFEDAAQAHGATYREKRAGALGDAAAFSFYPSKNLGALGDGGAICTDDSALAERARQLRDLGRNSGSVHHVAGYNERLDGLQAAFLGVKLRHLDCWNAARRERALWYRDALNESVELLGERDESTCVYHLFPIRCDARDDVATALGAKRISSAVHYPLSLLDQPPLAHLFDGIDAPVARDWAARELSLPLFPEMASGQVAAAAGAVIEASGAHADIAVRS